MPDSLLKILAVFGTRPEAIKMSPVIKKLKSEKKLLVKVCVTAQHREMLDQVLKLFNIEPDYDLNLMRANQSLTQLTSNILISMTSVYKDFKPDWVLVHGDTTTAMVVSITALYHKVKIAHVEAGLRTNNLDEPWPEEANRQLIGRLAKLHFAPTLLAKENLLLEGIAPSSIEVTGNTVIDALLGISHKLDSNRNLLNEQKKKFNYLDPQKKLIMITGHRRESYGAGFESICKAILDLAKEKDVELIYPVHLNPKVQNPVNRILRNNRNVHLIPPLDYLTFVYLMKRSYFILTDSGGIQEEAPSLGKPVLVMRNTTERAEGISAGTVKLVGSNRKQILTEAKKLLNIEDEYKLMSMAQNPYGNGKASSLILKTFKKLIS